MAVYWPNYQSRVPSLFTIIIDSIISPGSKHFHTSYCTSAIFFFYNNSSGWVITTAEMVATQATCQFGSTLYCVNNLILLVLYLTLSTGVTGKASCNNHDAKNMMSPKEIRSYSWCNIYGSLNIVLFFMTGFKKKKKKPRRRKKKKKDTTRFVFSKTGVNTRICQQS